MSNAFPPVNDRLAVLPPDGEGAEGHQRGENEQQDSRQRDVEGTLENVSHERHRTLFRHGAFLLAGFDFLLPLQRFPVHREQDGVDAPETPLQGVQVIGVFPEIDDAVVDDQAFLLAVGGQEAHDLVSAGRFGIGGQPDRCVARAGDQGRASADFMAHGPLFPAQCRKDIPRGDHQAHGQQDVHHDHQPGKFASRETDQPEEQQGDKDNLLDDDGSAQRAQRVYVQVSEFQPPETGHEAAGEDADQGSAQPDPHPGGESRNRIRQPADDEDGQ